MTGKWYVISVIVILAASIVSAILCRKGKWETRRIISPLSVIFGGVFLAITILNFPVLYQMYGGTSDSWELLCMSVVTTLQVFLVNIDVSFIFQETLNFSGKTGVLYLLLAQILYFIAPFLTFGVVLSFFVNMMSYLRYLFHYWGDIYVFSDCNEKALTLAKDIRKNHKRAWILFAGQKEEKDIPDDRVISLPISITRFPIRRHSRQSRKYIFFIHENENKNLKDSIDFVQTFSGEENINMYVFCSGMASEFVLSSLDTGKIKLRRMNEYQSMIHGFLYQQGYRLFEYAISSEKTADKFIGIAIIGDSEPALRMFKTLLWYCQMDGYQAEFYLLSSDAFMEDKMSADCPEIMERVHIYSGIHYDTKELVDILCHISPLTYLFTDLGSDEQNIEMAVRLRLLCERFQMKPMIQTMVSDTDMKRCIDNAVNFKGQAYEIEYIGDVKSLYSEENIISSALEEEARNRHLQWGEEREFWQYEYNYRASIATALHTRAKQYCQIIGGDKERATLNEKQRKDIERLEHRRWNMYMRTEGYIFSGSTDKSTRNDLGKMHHNITDYDSLNENDRKKDSDIVL